MSDDKAAVPGHVTTRIALDELARINPVALYELAELCRDPGHVLFGNTGEVLRGYGLVDHDGGVHEIVREVVLGGKDR